MCSHIPFFDGGDRTIPIWVRNTAMDLYFLNSVLEEFTKAYLQQYFQKTIPRETTKFEKPGILEKLGFKMSRSSRSVISRS